MGTPALAQRPIRVFLSSTSLDLKAEREAVIEVLREFPQLQADVMEEFYSRPERPIAECLEEVRRSQIYVGVIAHRYGSICPGFEESFTELEYRHALALERPCLIFLAKGGPGALPPEPKESVRKLRAFRSLLQENHVYSEFSTPGELARAVRASLTNYFQRPDFYAKRLPKPARIHQFLLTLCKEEDLRELCVKTGLPTWRDLPGKDRAAKITSLLEDVRRLRKVVEFEGLLRDLLPEIDWKAHFADDRDWLPPVSWPRRKWQQYRVAPPRVQVGLAVAAAVLMAIATYQFLPYQAQRGIKVTLGIWPAAATVPDKGWSDEFNPTADQKSWLKADAWKRLGLVGFEVRQIEMDPTPYGWLVLAGRTSAVWHNYEGPENGAALYDFDLESLASVTAGTRAAWLIRGSPDASAGYVLELNLRNRSIYARIYVRAGGQERPLLGGMSGNQLDVGACCSPGDNLRVWASARRDELTFWVKREPADPNDYFPPRKLDSIRDRTFPYGGVGVLETDSNSTMRVKFLRLYPVGSVKEMN